MSSRTFDGVRLTHTPEQQGGGMARISSGITGARESMVRVTVELTSNITPGTLQV